MNNKQENASTSNILLGSAMILTVFALSFSVLYAVDLPDVMVSTSTNKCVKVVNYNLDEQQFTCEHMPEKYNKVWVK